MDNNPLFKIVNEEDLFDEEVRGQLQIDFESLNEKSRIVTDVVDKISTLSPDDMDMLGSVLFSKDKELAIRLLARLNIETNF